MVKWFIDFPMDKMIPKTGYTSCIKICGVPLLPPLITEEKRKELNEDRQRAIEIEKKLKRKRSSIDSGVMTGSYIEQFRNSEPLQIDEAYSSRFSNRDLFFKANNQNTVPMTFYEPEDYVVSDSFLKTALEDPEFRQFFSITAEKIFSDSKIDDVLNLNIENDSAAVEVKPVSTNESESHSSEVLSECFNSLTLKECLELRIGDGITDVLSDDKIDSTFQSSETTTVIGNVFDDKQTEESSTSPTRNRRNSYTLAIPLIKESSSPRPRIRRNSYTLDSPSPVLLEHLAKEFASAKKETDKWRPLPDKKEKFKGPGFKTFSGRSQRKHWNKKISCPVLKVEHHQPRYMSGRSNTFVKPGKKSGETNYSLPSSSRTSPLQFYHFTRSVDCINSMVSNPSFQVNKGKKSNFSVNPNPGKNVGVFQNIFKKNTSYAVSDTDTFTVQKDSELQSTSVETSPTSLLNNPSSGVQSNCSTDNSPPQELSDSASQTSVTTQSTYVRPSSVSTRRLDDRSVPMNVNQSEDFDDIVSLCSSMSISGFLPTHDATRPSTADDLSEASIRQLKIKHENELRQLLEKQRKEEEIYSQLVSASGSVTSRTTNDISIGGIFETNSDLLFVEKEDSCSRELFPLQKLSPVRIQTKQQDDYSQVEKEAATKLTACARGYLTRRLLKTEKVQQLIELIKESLTCAFSLQLEPHLKPTDLDLHERLAHQLNAALCELQSIVSAPAAARMAIIAADRERLRRPASRPSSTISAATRKSIMRRQQSLNSTEKKPRESRARTKSFSVAGNPGSGMSAATAHPRSDSASTGSSRKPWR